MFVIVNYLIFFILLAYNQHVVRSHARDYVYRFRRGMFRRLSLQMLITLAVLLRLANSWIEGELLNILVSVGFLLMAVYSCISSAIHGEGISEKGLFAFLAFTSWKDIGGYEWRKHTNERDVYLILKMRGDSSVQSERYTVFNNIYQEEIDHYLRKYLDPIMKNG